MKGRRRILWRLCQRGKGRKSHQPFSWVQPCFFLCLQHSFGLLTRNCIFLCINQASKCAVGRSFLSGSGERRTGSPPSSNKSHLPKQHQYPPPIPYNHHGYGHYHSSHHWLYMPLPAAGGRMPIYFDPPPAHYQYYPPPLPVFCLPPPLAVPQEAMHSQNRTLLRPAAAAPQGGKSDQGRVLPPLQKELPQGPIKKRCKILLALPEDKLVLSPLRCFLRQHICAFEITKRDIAERTGKLFSVRSGRLAWGAFIASRPHAGALCAFHLPFRTFTMV